MVKKTESLGDMINKIVKSPIIEKLLYLLILLLIINFVYNYMNPQKEGFTEQKQIVYKKNGKVFDNFYVTVYDDLFYNKNKSIYEIGLLVNSPGPSEQTVVLDIGSGTGNHVALMESNGMSAIGIDNSSAMIEQARSNYPKLKFHEETVLNKEAFTPESFTHITCFNFTVYYFDNKHLFLENCYRWLMPGGCLLLNLVDKHKFDPIMQNGEPYEILGKKHMEKYGNENRIKFVGYNYKSNFEIYPNDDTAVFNERFKDLKTGKQRKQEQHLYMPTQKRILNAAKNVGFILIGKYNLSDINIDSQYIYILQKPN